MGLANGAVNTLGTVASGYGSAATGIGSTLMPFLTQQMKDPSGYSQQDLGAMLSSAAAAAGGAASGIVGQANQTAARTMNSGGFTGALDEASRQQMKAAAGQAEGIQASNAGVKLQQQQQAAGMLQSLYGTDVGAQQQAYGTQANNIKSAQSEGFMARLGQITSMLQGAGSTAAGLGVKV